MSAAQNPQAASAIGALHLEWAALLMDGFATAGVRRVVVSPGSRSTPLLLAALRDARLETHDVVDERSAAFFALGAARATGVPVVLLCTSGTAGAHHYPAVIEAALTGVPLIVVTADRPLEHSDCGAAQAIDQVKLFGDHVRGFFEVGTPEADDDALRAVRRIATQAVARALDPQPGPVHVNARFRKPLEPQAAATDPATAARIARARAVAAPSFFVPRRLADPSGVQALARACARAKRGVIVAGPAPIARTADREAIFALAAATGFPILAETASQLRGGGTPEGVTRIEGFDALLRAASFRRAFAPDLIVQIGGTPVSEGYARLVAASANTERWILSEHGWHDPHSSASAHLPGEIGETASAVTRTLGPRAASSWARDLATAADGVRAIVEEELALAPFWDGAIARAVFERIPAGSILALGNSLPIRDVDTWTAGAALDADVLSQRGANGIDGLISSAAGAGAASGKPVTLLVGDVSFLHDLHGLAVAQGLATPLVIVVVQNHGGRIFEQLPLAAAPGIDAATMAHWITPPDADLALAARTFGHRHVRVDDATALKGAIAEAHRRAETTILEAVVPPHEGTARYRKLWTRVEGLFS